jgi:hypothetical protein
MTSGDSLLPLPDARRKETNYLARSGAVVTLRLIDTDRWELKIDTRSDYTAVLSRRGDGLFDLQPAPGVAATPYIDVTERDLYERF